MSKKAPQYIEFLENNQINIQQHSIPIDIDDKKKLYNSILDILDYSDDAINQKEFQIIKSSIFENKQLDEKKDEITEFLQIIKNLADNHNRKNNFIKKIELILQYFQEQIKQTLSNEEIYKIFEDNKIILLILFKNKTISISNEIYESIINKIDLNGTKYCHFFYPEIKEYLGEGEVNEIKNELLSINSTILENFDKKREKGENDSYICSLIREDSSIEFISYINRTNISLKSQIKSSIFETNSFLIENEPSLIEYAAFFGSIEIFQYLLMNGVEIESNLWFFVIHSKNAELIHLLESFKVEPPKNNYEECLIESIKCHHNEIAHYFENAYLFQDQNDANDNVISNILKYHNYEFFPKDFETRNEFFYLCKYNYNKLVNFYIEKKEEEIKMKIIKQIDFFLFYEIIKYNITFNF